MISYWAEQAVVLCKDIDDESIEEYAEPVRIALEALQHDRRVIVIGGKGSGKSAVLAGLAEAPVIASYKMEGHYLCWRFTCRDGDATGSRFLPLPHLAGLELVDTAACDMPAVRETCMMLLQGADAVVGVVHGAAPEGSPVWDMVAALPEAMRAACLIVVTHVDKLGAEAVLRLKETMRELSRKRVGMVLPLYFASPGESGDMAVLRSRVQEAMQGAHALRATVRSLAERTSDMVEKQGRVLRARETVSRTDSGFIAGIEQEIDYFSAHQMQGLQAHQECMNGAVMRVVPPLLQRIRESFGWALSPTALLRLELMGGDTDKTLYQRMEEEVKHLQTESDRQFAHACASHWSKVRPRMKKTLECEIGDFPEESLAEELRGLRERLCRELYEPFANTNLRHRLFRLFIAQASWMRASMVFICFLLVVAGVFGFIGHDVLGLICVVAAALVWVGGSVYHRLVCGRICDEVAMLIEHLREAMAVSMRGALERLIISRVAAYRRLYTTPRQKVARQDAMLRPLQERQKNIHIQLRSLIPRL